MGKRGLAILSVLLAGFQAIGAGTPVVRVGLLSLGSVAKATVSSSEAFAAFDPESQAQIGAWAGGSAVAVTAKGAVVEVGGKTFSRLYFSSKGPILDVKGTVSRPYRGWIHVSAEAGKLVLVNEAPLDTYLMGVVPCEMSASAPEEALKAQAIVSRSYVITKIDKWATSKYDVDDSVNCQVYRGAQYEKEASTKAVRDTAGLLLTYQGKVVNAIFGANSGGMTEPAHEVWGGAPYSYLGAVLDTDPQGKPYAENSKHFLWTASFTASQVESALSAAKKSVGTPLDIRIEQRSSTGRAARVLIYGSSGTVSVAGSELRKYLGYDKLWSTWFNVVKEGGGWRFDGRGWGHGVGMCQDGAVGRAKAGQSFRQILAAYYPGTSVALVRGEPLQLSTRGSVVNRRKFSG